jgi:hypothetical protein
VDNTATVWQGLATEKAKGERLNLGHDRLGEPTKPASMKANL